MNQEKSNKIVETYQQQKPKLLRKTDDILIHCRITAKNNGNGSTTVIWEPTFTALNSKGNAMVQGMVTHKNDHSEVIKMIENYLCQKQ